MEWTRPGFTRQPATDMWWSCVCVHVFVFMTVVQNLRHPGVINLERMYETPERVSSVACLVRPPRILHPFNGPFSRTIWISLHQKGKPFWILMKQEMRWQWHQLDHMQIICTSLQTDNHACTSSLGPSGIRRQKKNCGKILQFVSNCAKL